MTQLLVIIHRPHWEQIELFFFKVCLPTVFVAAQREMCNCLVVACMQLWKNSCGLTDTSLWRFLQVIWFVSVFFADKFVTAMNIFFKYPFIHCLYCLCVQGHGRLESIPADLLQGYTLDRLAVCHRADIHREELHTQLHLRAIFSRQSTYCGCVWKRKPGNPHRHRESV